MTICECCEENETEGGDVFCGACRARHGDDTGKLETIATHRAQTRANRYKPAAALIIAALTPTKHQEAAE
jgi:hypothetical protein